MEPLYIDERIAGSSKGHYMGIRRLLKWLDDHTPLILTERIGRGRKSAERQLAARASFPFESWELTGRNADMARSLLSAVCRIMQLPNDHVLPNDPLRLLLSPGYDALSIDELLFYLEAEYDIGRNDVNSLLEQDSVAKDLIDAMAYKASVRDWEEEDQRKLRKFLSTLAGKLEAF